MKISKITIIPPVEEVKTYCFTQRELQNILNVYFEVIGRISQRFTNRADQDCSKFWDNHEDVMSWAGEALSYVGLHSRPIGSSWVSLDIKKMEEAAD